MHGIGVVGLFQANRALGAVGALEATMQAVMSHAAIAIAVARLLVQHGGNFRRQFVRVSLKRILGIVAPELLFAKNGRQNRSFGWRAGVERRRLAFLL